MDKIGRWFRKLFHRDRKIVVPTPGPMPDNREYISAKRVKEIINEQIGSLKGHGFHVHLADEFYYCPSLSYLAKFLRDDLLDSKQYAKERFDCDDFAWILKARFCLDAYKDGTRRAAHAAGVVHGKLPNPHAMNWVITDDMKLRLIEPQTDKFKNWGDDFSIWMMAG